MDRIKIGIDPPHGLAVSAGGRIYRVLSCETLEEIFRTLKKIFSVKYRAFEVIIEIPHGLGSHRGKGLPINAQRRISANIGQVYQSAKAIEAFCHTEGVPVRLQKSCKWLTKLNSERFKQITGYVGRTNQHGRDAAMLVYEKRWLGLFFAPTTEQSRIIFPNEKTE